MPTPPVPVALVRRADYEPTGLDQALDALWPHAGLPDVRGMNVLLKPNLVSRANARLCCTHPRVVAAAARRLLDAGARVAVADSPAFGSAASVARACGLDAELKPLGLRVAELDRPVRTPTPSGLAAGISRTALDADAILNLPRLKAHSQARATGAIKNLFGCVTGPRKALAHALHGHDPHAFFSMILDLEGLLPPTGHLLDAVVSMQHTGPIHGDPCPTGFLAASPGAAALDATAFELIGLPPGRVPLLALAMERGLPGVDPADRGHPLLAPGELDIPPFALVDELSELSFHPWRLAKGRAKSLWHRLRG